MADFAGTLSNHYRIRVTKRPAAANSFEEEVQRITSTATFNGLPTARVHLQTDDRPCIDAFLEQHGGPVMSVRYLDRGEPRRSPAAGIPLSELLATSSAAFCRASTNSETWPEHSSASASPSVTRGRLRRGRRVSFAHRLIDGGLSCVHGAHVFAESVTIMSVIRQATTFASHVVGCFAARFSRNEGSGLILDGIHYATGEGLRLHIRDGRIAGIESVESKPSWPYIAPGFVDVQVNGYGGQDFNDPELTVEKVRQIVLPMDRDGVTASCPTLTTHSFELMHHAIETIAQACDEDPEVARRVAGVHVEGPYLSEEDGPRGAHPRKHIRAPDWDEFQKWQEASGSRIAILTLAPEYDEVVPFIRQVVDSGVVVSIGHTAASPDQVKAAVDAGASMSTHLGNGAHGEIRRHPNYIWEQLADDRLVASLIVDGHHLPASVVKSFVRGKHPSRCVVVSDITGLGGMPPGRYQTQALGDVEVLDDGRLVVGGQRQFLAGAALPIHVAIANLIRFAAVSLDEAIQMASIRPSEIVGFPVTRLEVGCTANVIRFDLPDLATNEPITIRENVIAGERVYSQE